MIVVKSKLWLLLCLTLFAVQASFISDIRGSLSNGIDKVTDKVKNIFGDVKDSLQSPLTKKLRYLKTVGN